MRSDRKRHRDFRRNPRPQEPDHQITSCRAPARSVVASSRRSVAQILPGAACQSRGLLAKRRSPVHTDNPCFGGKAPGRIESVDVIDRASLHVSRILAFAQCRRDARHHRRRNAPDMTRSRTVNMAAEDWRRPAPECCNAWRSPAIISGVSKLMRVRPHRNLERRMVRENRNRLRGLGIYHGRSSASARSAQKSPLLLPVLKVSTAISLTG